MSQPVDLVSWYIAAQNSNRITASNYELQKNWCAWCISIETGKWRNKKWLRILQLHLCFVITVSFPLFVDCPAIFSRIAQILLFNIYVYKLCLYSLKVKLSQQLVIMKWWCGLTFTIIYCTFFICHDCTSFRLERVIFHK